MTQCNDQYLKDNNIFFENKSDFENPILDYSKDYRLVSDLSRKLFQLNFIKPTPIQAVSIPIILTKKDFIGVSETGSGKTLAFLVPGINFLSQLEKSNSQNCYVRMLVVAPTRELAIQTYEVFKKLNSFDSICVYGGSSRISQYNYLKLKKPLVVIGTPGRINDFIESGIIYLEKCYYLVLDEADRMLDMGFYPQIKKIIDRCPPKKERQTLLFSATWTKKVQSMANSFLNSNRVLVSIGPLYSLNACSDIKQHLFLVNEHDKKNILKKILKEFKGFKILIFTSTKMRAQFMSDFCNNLHIHSDFIHGDVPQSKREKIIKDFNQGHLMVIFATDVASRGLDIKNIHVVVNYDFPIDVETYVHRIGRSGRNGTKGLAFTFVTKSLLENITLHKKLLKVVRESGNQIPRNLVI